MPIELHEVILKVSKKLFLSYSEAIRFCIVNTLIHLSESELIEKLEFYDIKRYIKINENEVEINGHLYRMSKGGKKRGIVY